MKIHVYGNKNNKVLLLLHPMYLNGKYMVEKLKMADKDILEKFYIIAPDLSSHGEDKNVFLSIENETCALKNYLQENNINKIHMLYGLSLGANVGINLVNNTNIDFTIMYFDSISAFKESKLLLKLYYLYDEVLFRKNKYVLKFQEKIFEKFFGKRERNIIVKTFLKMKKESAKNITKSIYTMNFKSIPIFKEKKMYFSFNAFEFDRLSIYNLKKYFPFANYNVRKGGYHMEYFLFETKKLVEELGFLLKKQERLDYIRNKRKKGVV